MGEVNLNTHYISTHRGIIRLVLIFCGFIVCALLCSQCRGHMNTAFFSSNRGIIKIAQIIIGFVITSLLCSDWYGGRTCYQEGRLGYTSGLNSICVIINIVFLILNFLSLSSWSLERIYNIVASILFLIAAVLLVWYLVQFRVNTQFYITTGLVVTMFCLYIWDIKILQGESPN